MTIVLGISAFYHDSAAVIMIDDEIVAAAQEERFTRKKHDPSFPINAIRYVLEESRCTVSDLDYITFYDKPLLKFDRLFKTYVTNAPFGIISFVQSMSIWVTSKLFTKRNILKNLASIDNSKHIDAELLFTSHHQSHAASAFFASPFAKAAVVCMDGVGEWTTTSIWYGHGNKLELIYSIEFPHSLGLLYSAITYYCGFKVNSGEYKLMGLAPYGKPLYTDLIFSHLIELKDDGSYKINMDYFDYEVGSGMTNGKLHDLFGKPPRDSESELSQFYMDVAASIQKVTEITVQKIATFAKEVTSCTNLCLAGGVALNCVANGKILKEGIFEKLWIQPAAGDAGGAIGAALSTWYQYLDSERKLDNEFDKMKGAYLGRSFSDQETIEMLALTPSVYEITPDEELLPEVAKLIAANKVVGWHSGKMEFGPRALGCRSILGDPRSEEMQLTMNLKIKYRESFRPFAPAVLCEKVGDWFDCEYESPYMLIVAPVKKDRRILNNSDARGLDKLKVTRSTIPAVTHIDFSARIQSVHRETNPRFYNLINEFYKHTGVPMLINTSFNVRGEPIVYSPADAYRCFMRTEMDYLVIGNLLFDKKKQINNITDEKWKTEFELD